MEGMAVFGAILGGLALLGIIIAYTIGESRTPGWGWKKQVEEDAEASGGQMGGPTSPTGGQAGGPTQVAQPGAMAPQPTPAAPAASSPRGGGSAEQELEEAVQRASQERESVGR